MNELQQKSLKILISAIDKAFACGAFSRHEAPNVANASFNLEAYLNEINAPEPEAKSIPGGGIKKPKG